MEDIHIKPSKNTPRIDFYSNGNLLLAGSVYSENAKEFFDPIINWVIELKIDVVNFDLKIEYINTACAKKLFELLQELSQNSQVETVNVKWFYLKGDEDALETGQILSESIPKLNFRFVEYDG